MANVDLNSIAVCIGEPVWELPSEVRELARGLYLEHASNPSVKDEREDEAMKD